VTSYCDRTFANSSHKIGVNPVNWSCYYGVKEQTFDFDANVSLSQAEAGLTADIVKNLTDDIFNKIFSNW
jgi:hypothetical protein